MTSPPAEPNLTPLRASLPLERALLFTFLAHAAGMISMATCILPAVPGGSAWDVHLRASYLAQHPWVWRLGWLGWQVTALSDLLLAVALLATPWISKRAALATLALTVAGLAPDQLGQFRWTWPGVALARDAVATGSFDSYEAFEVHTFRLIAAWGTIGYLAAALGWTWCFATAGVWSRGLTRLSIFTWSLFAIATGVLYLPESMQRSRALGTGVAVGNAVAFVLLMIWLAAVTERVLRRARPDTRYGHFAPWRHAGEGWFPRLSDALANSRFVCALFERLPAASMASDISDVVYVNYLVDVTRLAPMIPRELELQRLGPDGAFALFTHLTYRHGHFGMRIFGPLRRLWPSPIQSNWRLYVTNPATGLEGVYFLTTAITSTPHALAARLLSEGVPMHVPASVILRRSGDGTMLLSINPDRGTAPDLAAELAPMPGEMLSGRWAECFGSWRDVLAYCVPQDRALAAQPWYGRVTRQEIALDIPLEVCRPLRGKVYSRAARAIAGEEAAAEPLCFYVERVAFRYLGESYDV